MLLEINISLASDTGCVRSNNEDMILVSGETYRDCYDSFTLSVGDRGRFVAAVADGMGGHNAGEIASETALTSFDDFIISIPDNMPERDFRRLIDVGISKIHRKLNQYGLSNDGCNGMGTTLVAWITYENRIYIINCGDSRVYRYRNGILCQLTTDHSERERLRDISVPSNQIYNCLGGGSNFAFADIFEITNKVFKNDLFLLCSDGLTDLLSDDEIEASLIENPDVCNLIDTAKQKGGYDNISVVNFTIKNIKI